ncbi:MAG: hypothetical protein ACI959_001653 [Limisphaerales bacterium]|jgi:hypothetical protein
MIIYNVTVKINLEVHDNWLAWMKESHIPDVMHTGYFKGHKLVYILDQDEAEGKTYAIQYFCESIAKLKEYQDTAAPVLQEEHTAKFKDQFVAFRTIMEEVDIS